MGTTVISLNGLPGSGKTTLANSLASKLKDGRTVFDIDDVFNKKNSHAKKFFQIFSLRNLPINTKILLSGIKESNATSCLKPMKNAFTLIRYRNILQSFIISHRDSTIVLSEGPIHFFSVIYDNGEAPDDKLNRAIIKALPAKNCLTITINADIPIKEAERRINTRSSKPNSIDLMDKKKLHELLKTRQKNIDTLRKMADTPTINIDMLRHVQANSNTILKQIVDLEKGGQ